jgi:plastocyanin
VTPAVADLKHRGHYLRPPARSLLFALACAWGAFCPTADARAAGAADKVASHTVVMEGVAYQPEVLDVKRGDRVVWINKDPFPHTVTAAGAFASSDIRPGASWSYVARKTGTFGYICTLHPNMKGTLTVR